MSPIARGGASADGGLYLWIVDLAQRAPSWADSLISAWSTYGLALFGLLMAAAWWRARARAGARAQARASVERQRAVLALMAPLFVVTAFLVDTGIKSLIREQRPCQSLHALTLEACPPLGDWSFPSNHAAIAAAAATTLWFTDRRLAALAVPAAFLMAVSRVWVGVHYPHDVLVGLAAGAVVAWFLVLMAGRVLRRGPRAPEYEGSAAPLAGKQG
ncbi:phosphatase PAP2 family protein [Streptomyces sp. NPDC058401]|uniref:phosphatase PAP2 family protein n=1 Tax=Streptomyces sp. NPDC058401 TaxID=3346480 RepID=UPI00364D9D97